MKREQRVVVAAEVLRQPGCAGDHLIEHAAQGRTIDYTGLHGEADDAPSELIHDDHHPMALEDQRFTTKEIDTPEAVLGVSEEHEPGRTVGAEGVETPEQLEVLGKHGCGLAQGFYFSRPLPADQCHKLLVQACSDVSLELSNS